MWKCRYCKHMNRLGAKYCEECGRFRTKTAELNSRGAMQGTIKCTIHGHAKKGEVVTSRGFVFDVCGVCGAHYNMRR